MAITIGVRPTLRHGHGFRHRRLVIQHSAAHGKSCRCAGEIAQLLPQAGSDRLPNQLNLFGFTSVPAVARGLQEKLRPSLSIERFPVPSVASEVNASLSLPQSQKWRPQPSSSDSAPQPFASLLDATAPAPEVPPEPDAQNPPQRAEPPAPTSSPHVDNASGTAAKSASAATDGPKSPNSGHDGRVANKKDDKDSKAGNATTSPDTKAKAEDVPATSDDGKDKDTDGKDPAATNATAPVPAPTTPQPVATAVAVTGIVVDTTAPTSDADKTGTIDADKTAKPVVLDPAATAPGDAKDAAAGDNAAGAANPAIADGTPATPTPGGKPATDAKAQPADDTGKPVDGTGDRSSKGVHTTTAKAVEQTAAGHSDVHHEATPDLDGQGATAGAADDQHQAAVKPNADAVPNFGFSASNTATAAPTTAAATPTVTVPIAGLAVEIAARAQAGSNRFDIRLDPPELGRIDVRLDVNRDGQVTSHVTVDRPETLALLQQEQPNLERALEQSGLKTADNGLQFTLRDQSFAGQDNGGRSGQNAARIVIPDADLSTVDTISSRYRSFGVGGGVDISV
jgi:flagellar hook-length control protein FliK